MGGGAAANTASWLAAAGTPVRLVGAVGDDLLGRGALEDLEATGVELAVTIDHGPSTGSCVVIVHSSGERTMLPDRGANDGLPDPSAVAAHSEGASLLSHIRK